MKDWVMEQQQMKAVEGAVGHGQKSKDNIQVSTG